MVNASKPSAALLWITLLGTLAVNSAGWAQAEQETPVERYRVEIHNNLPIVSIPAGEAAGEPGTAALTIDGVTDALPGSRVEITLEGITHATTVGPRGRFALPWPEELALGSYTVEVVVRDGENGFGRARQGVLIAGDRLPARPLLAPPIAYQDPEGPASEDFQEMTDRWRIAPPPYELNVRGRRWDPYNQNMLKGDYPIFGQDVFLVVTAVSDTLVDLFEVPTPSGVSQAQPGEPGFFGDNLQLLATQTVLFSTELFQGDTAFKPFDWRIRATLGANFNLLDVGENAVVRPDVREGTRRTDGFVALQEAFGEVKLADLSPNYDFLSLRAGIQPFASDFRGFVFTDTNLGVRLFGSLDSNRTQFNLAYFDRLEKDTNSGLNTFESRDQKVAIANIYRQDFLAKGYTVSFSVHHLRDEPTFFFDENGFLARPDPLGSFTPHEIEATYFGWTSFGHIGRVNIDSALYYVTGDDSLNPLAGPDPNPAGSQDAVKIDAVMAALELSIDRNWYRPKLGYFYASGDDDPTDREARGFDAIFDSPNFAGGGFSFWNRLGFRLPATGVALVHRGSLLPDLTANREEGQPNFVNPGIHIVTAGLDLELSPEVKAVLTANLLRFDATEPIELALFQGEIEKEIGLDLSVGVRYRPFMSQNIVLVGGAAALIPDNGFQAIFGDDTALFTGFFNLILTF